MERKENKIKNESFFVVQGYMVNELKLKGNELLVYAIINSFSQLEDHSYHGSLSHLANWTNSTVRGIQKTLKSLLDNGLLTKKEKIVDGVKRCDYTTTYCMEQSSTPYGTKFVGVWNSVHGGMEQSSPNNKEDTKEDNIKENTLTSIKEKSTRFVPPTLEEVKKFCEENNIDIDCEQFWYFYDSTKWKRGKGTQITNWKSCVRTWERNKKSNANNVEEHHGQYTNPNNMEDDWYDIWKK